MIALRLTLTVVLAWLVAASLQSFGGEWAVKYLAAQVEAGRVQLDGHSPLMWSFLIDALALLLAVVLKVVIFATMREQLPGQTGAAKGLWFGVLLLGASGILQMAGPGLRQGFPLDVVALQVAPAWAVPIVTGLLIGLLTPVNWRPSWAIRSPASAN